jgi:hypothetical protein
VDYIEDPQNNSLPPDLELAFQVQQWSVLPEAGGLRDQRLGEMQRLTVVANTYKVWTSFKNAPKPKWKWIKNNPEDYAAYMYIHEIRQEKANA